MRHICAPGWTDKPENKAAYGAAITECGEDDEGALWAGNGEYYTKVSYCPFCGVKAPLQVGK